MLDRLLAKLERQLDLPCRPARPEPPGREVALPLRAPASAAPGS
jgi:hypothetical protein